MATLNTTGGGAYIDGASPLGISDFPFTIAAYVRRTGSHSDNGYIASIGNSNSGDNLHTLFASPTDRARCGSEYNDGGLEVTATLTSFYLSSGAWEKCVATFTGQSRREIFMETLSNNLVDTSDCGGFTSASDSINGTGGRFMVGERPDTVLKFQGLVSHVAVWDKVLSDAEITDFMNAVNPLDIASTNLVGYWATDISGSTWTDESGNGNDLTLTGGASIDTTTEEPTVDAPTPTGPTFTTTPSVTSRTTDSYTIGGTVDTDSTVYAVAQLSTSTDPSEAQIEAGLTGDGVAAPGTGSVSATADVGFSFDITGANLGDNPTHDIHIVSKSSS